MVTIRDVARKAGVSRSTVSLVLNNNPLVKDETRRHVLEVIKELNYVPNNNARGLSSKTNNSLGLVVFVDKTRSPDQFSYDFNQSTGMCSYSISNGIMLGLAETDYGVITERFCSVDEPDELPRVVKNRRVDGVFLVGNPYSPKLMKKMQETGIPMVIAGVDSYEDEIDSVYADPGVGTVMELEHLLETGHKKICLVNSPKNYHSSYTRVKAVSEYVGKNGIDFDFEWVIFCKSNRGESGYETFKEFWEAGNRPDGVITANGQIALGVMRYLYENNIRVPEDVSIVAYEDSSLCGYATPGLTVVNIRKEALGEQAAKCLLQRMQNPEKKVEHIVIEPYMVERQSVEPR